MSWRVEHGSCLELLQGLEESSVDAVVTDPPYGLGKEPKPVELLEAWLKGDDYQPGKRGFMGRKWDSFVPGPHYWREVFRVLKPGGHAVVFAGTRTTDLMTLSLRLAGFEIRDELQWIYGSGFPKSHNVRKATGNAAIATSGTALKPAHEPIVLARKPLRQTIGKNVTEHGTGALNIDGCRVAHASADDLAAHEAGVNAIKARGGSMENSWKNSSDLSGASDVSTDGRWPPNILLSHSPECICTGTEQVKANPTWDTPNRDTEPSSFTGDEVSKVCHGAEEVPVWECVEGCPVQLIGKQSGTSRSVGGLATKHAWTKWGAGSAAESTRTNAGGLGDTGTASRYFPQFEWTDLDDVSPFFYCPKASRSERDAGLDAFKAATGGEATGRKEGSAGTKDARAGAGRNGGSRNIHPTVKPIALMRWLCRLITPPGGTIIDPFCGSGTTGIAAVLEGFNFIGYELNDSDAEPFVRLARARIEHAEHNPQPIKKTKAVKKHPSQVSLF